MNKPALLPFPFGLGAHVDGGRTIRRSHVVGCRFFGRGFSGHGVRLFEEPPRPQLSAAVRGAFKQARLRRSRASTAPGSGCSSVTKWRGRCAQNAPGRRNLAANSGVVDFSIAGRQDNPIGPTGLFSVFGLARATFVGAAAGFARGLVTGCVAEHSRLPGLGAAPEHWSEALVPLRAEPCSGGTIRTYVNAYARLPRLGQRRRCFCELRRPSRLPTRAVFRR